MAQVEKFYFPDDLYYEPEDHLWVKIEGEFVRIGMDQLGAESAGTIMHMKITPVAKVSRKKSNFGFLEAGKFVGPLKMPIDGRVLAVNQKVLDHPVLVNREPYGEGWLIRVQPENLAENLRGLLHGEEAVARWLKEKVQDYRERGILPQKGT